jgi:hypothetical protein
MKHKTKFGISTLLAMVLSMSFALAQESKPSEKPNDSKTATEHQALKKDWENFQHKAEASAANPAQKPALEKEYNQLIERVELLCEGIQEGTKSPGKGSTPALLAPATKPKREQAAMK